MFFPAYRQGSGFLYFARPISGAAKPESSPLQ
jgi:hypothetical protein